MELSRRSFLKLSGIIPAAVAWRLPLVPLAPAALAEAAPVETTGRVMQWWMDALEVLPAGRNVIVGTGAGMLRQTKDIFGVFYANDGDVLLPISGQEKHVVVRLGDGQARLSAVDELQESDMLLARVYDGGAGLAVEDLREYLEYGAHSGRVLHSEWGDPETSYPAFYQDGEIPSGYPHLLGNDHPEPDIIFKES